MSFKHHVHWDGDTRCVLPRVAEMQCEVVAFLTPELWEATDEGLWRQAVQSASYEGVTHVFLMPDTHLGFGVPIGGVVVSEGTLIQAGSGYDISCGVLYMRAKGLHASDVADPAKRLAWIRAVEERVATGLGSHRPSKMPSYSAADIVDFMVHGAEKLGVDPGLCERPAMRVDTEVFDPHRIEKAWGKAIPQMGSLGGGNHFVEVQVNPADSSVWLMIHCGSRGFGWHTANHYYYEGARLRGLQPRQREQSHLMADEPLGREYWAHHNAAANYAIVNRHVIARGVSDATQEVFDHEAEVYYEISHNLIQEERIFLPDGSLVEGFVHRKGATRAFPPGHPDLARTKWADTGHPVLIPGSMRDGAAILFPLEGAQKSGCSVNHGAGRLLGRGQAKRELRPIQEDIDDEMRDARVECADGTVVSGIVMNGEHTPLDECGMAYKDLDAVLAVLEAEGIAAPYCRMYPVANLKGLG